MANPDNLLHGIYRNQRLMDLLYRYGVEHDIEKCAMYRVSSLNICLFEIKSNAQHSEEWKSYFNYMRWNQKDIVSELNFYLLQARSDKLFVQAVEPSS